MFQREGTTSSGGVLFWAVVFAGITALLFGWYAPSFQARHGLPVVDVDGALSAARTLELVTGYGSAGRHDYLVFLSIDCVFPVAASLFTIALFHTLLRWLGSSERTVRRVLLVPALAAVCDLVENTLEALLTLFFPLRSELFAKLAVLATGVKLGALAVTCAVLLGLCTLSWRRWLATRRTSP